MLFRFLSPRNLASAVLRVLANPHRRRLGGTSGGERDVSGDRGIGGLGDARGCGRFRGRYRAGKPPEPHPVSDGGVADRISAGGVPSFWQPMATRKRSGGRVGIERLAVRFFGKGSC